MNDVTTYSELRVHGVSGTPPRDMLYTDPLNVEGQYPNPDPRSKPKSYARIVGRPHRDQRDKVGFDVRGFHWGGLTSGPAITAFWILLAPFALANTAGWMLARPTRLRRALVRVTALALTAIFATQLGTSMVLAPQLWDTSGLGWWADVVVLLTSIGAPLAFTGLIAFFSTRSHVSFEPWSGRLRRLFIPSRRAVEELAAAEARDSEWPPIGENGTDGWKLRPNRSPSVFIEFHERAADSESPAWDDPADGASITGFRMWHETTLLPRLTRLHLAAGYGVITLIVGAQADLPWVVWVSLALLVVVTAAVAVMSFAPTRLQALSTYATMVSAIWVVVAYVAAWTATPAANPYAAHVVTFWVGAVFVLLAVGVLMTREVLAAGALALAGQIGTILGIIVGYLVQSVFGITAANKYSLQANGSEWVAVALFFEIAFLVLTALWLTTRRGDAYHPQVDEVELDPGPGRFLVLGRRIVQRADWILKVAAGYGALTILSVVAAFIVGGETPDPRNLPQPDSNLLDVVAVALAIVIVLWVVVIVIRNLKWSARSGVVAVVAAVVVGVGVAASIRSGNLRIGFLGLEATFDNLTAIAVGLAVILPGSFMLRSILKGIRGGEAGRRQVGILWDLTTFWPRWFSPIGPPSYGPFVVRTLRDRLIRGQPPDAADPGAGFDVLGAHSQGSLIAGIVVERLMQEAASEPGRDPDRVPRAVVEGRLPERFVTYGSQLGGLYRLMFPNVGIQGLCASLCEGSVTWRNLWRPTDPIGGHWVDELDGGNVQVMSNLERGHSAYELTEEYWSARV